MGVGERLLGLFRAPGADLIPPPEGWWRELGDEVLEYLHGVGVRRASDVNEERDRQERKAVVLMAWALALISASGLLGDLDLGGDATGIASWCALGMTGAIVAAATYVFWPRDWDRGVNVAWLAHQAPAGSRELRGETVDALVTSYCVNANHLRRRGRVLDLMTFLMPVQALAVVLVQVLGSGA